jgi:hypothetical protein
MNSVDKIFKAGILIVAIGFLVVYAFSRRQSALTTPHLCGRYSLSISNSTGPFYGIYMVDTQEGTVYYAERNLAPSRSAEPVTWRITKPKEEAKK